MYYTLSDFSWGEVGVAATAGKHRSQFTPLMPWGPSADGEKPKGRQGTRLTQRREVA